MRLIAAAVLASAAPSLAWALSPPAPLPLWTVDKAGSRVAFRTAMSGTAIDGRFQRWDARIQFDPKNLGASKVTATIDLASVTTGDQTRDEALPSSDWFAIAKFPRASFVSRAITPAGPNRYVAAGDLMLRGVKRPVNLPFTLAINGDVAKMTGSVALDRTAFGVGQGQFKTGATVDTKVTVNIAVAARRAS